MRATLLAVILAVVATGCATRTIQLPDGTIVRQREVMPQAGVVVTVQNNCSPVMAIESLHGPEVGNLVYGRSATLPVPARAFGGYNREVWVMAKAYTAGLQYIGSAVLREFVSTYDGTRDRIWQVDRLDSPSGARCPSPP